MAMGDSFVKVNFQCFAIRLESGEKIPFRQLTVDFDLRDVEIAAIEDNLLGLCVCDGLQVEGDAPL